MQPKPPTMVIKYVDCRFRVFGGGGREGAQKTACFKAPWVIPKALSLKTHPGSPVDQ